MANNIDLSILENGRLLPLVEEFYTLQGEGYHTGRAAYFIRIGGCDVGCSWCDAKFTWNANAFPPVNVNELVDRIKDNPAKAVVVTGGEPSLYPLDYLCELLKSNDISTFVETSGAYPLTGQWDWICLSPKPQQHPVNGIHMKADELKVIISSQSDIEWAEYNAKKVKTTCKLYLQPEWSKYNEVTPWLVEYVKENPRWQISLQAHKFMRIP
ncbi:MAG: 7-carboxy-7-deazaguanine synthase QueE [Perlabentimonas sp.]